MIDDHAVVRAGCRLLLSQQDDIVLMESATGEEGLQDMRIIGGIYESAQSGKSVKI